MPYVMTRDVETLRAVFERSVVERNEAVYQLAECWPLDDVETFETFTPEQLARAVSRTFDQGYDLDVTA